MITVERVSGEMLPYFMDRSSERQPPAFIVLDCETGKVYVTKGNGYLWKKEPEKYLDHKCFWQVSRNLEISTVNRIMKHISILAPQILDGHSVVRDGDNLIDIYSDDANKVMMSIDAFIYNEEQAAY